MAFGTGAGGAISRQTNRSAQVADKLNENGEIVEQTTHGSFIEVTEETYDDADVANEATDGQTGTEVTTGDNIVESNQDYCKRSVTKRTVPGGGV